MFDGISTFGVSNFILDNCIIDGNSENQLGLKFAYFDSNFTITNCVFSSLGSAIIVCISNHIISHFQETATSESSLEAPQSFNQFLIKNSVVQNSHGSINLRGNQSNPTSSFTLQNISWTNIQNDNSSIKVSFLSFFAKFARLSKPLTSNRLIC